MPRDEFSYLALIRSILEARSMTTIQYTLDANLLDTGLSEHQRSILQKMHESNDLDEIWLLCAKELGLNTQVEEIGMWLEKKAKSRPAASDLDYLQVG
jgi:hypothetical protein